MDGAGMFDGGHLVCVHAPVLLGSFCFPAPPIPNRGQMHSIDVVDALGSAAAAPRDRGSCQQLMDRLSCDKADGAEIYSSAVVSPVCLLPKSFDARQLKGRYDVPTDKPPRERGAGRACSCGDRRWATCSRDELITSRLSTVFRRAR